MTTILVVDDDPDVRELLGIMLEMADFEVRFAADGLEGLAAVEHEAPDAVLLDSIMPGCNGIEVCRRLRAHPRTAAIPVLMISVRATATEIRYGLDCGVDEYITKPFSPRHVVARLEAALARAVGTPR